MKTNSRFEEKARKNALLPSETSENPESHGLTHLCRAAPEPRCPLGHRQQVDPATLEPPDVAEVPPMMLAPAC